MPGASILFVDDEPGIRATLPRILEQEGFAVTTAASVGEALGLISRQPFDVLISDLNIGHPGDGFTLVSAMRRTQPEAVTFILTGFPDFESALRAIRSQVDDYLVKPASVSELVASIKNRIVGRQPRRAIRLQRSGDFLISQRDRILRTWIDLVGDDRELSQIPLSLSVRLQFLPELLAGICGRVNVGARDLDEQTRTLAIQFAQIRHRHGYSLRLMILENRLLQRSMTDALQDNLLALDISTMIGDLLNIGEQFSLCTEEWWRVFESGKHIDTVVRLADDEQKYGGTKTAASKETALRKQPKSFPP